MKFPEMIVRPWGRFRPSFGEKISIYVQGISSNGEDDVIKSDFIWIIMLICSFYDIIWAINIKEKYIYKKSSSNSFYCDLFLYFVSSLFI